MANWSLLDWFQFFCCGLFNFAGGLALWYHFGLKPLMRLTEDE